MPIKIKNNYVPEVTGKQFDEQIKTARELFSKKNKDYGTSWRILRFPSLVDQIFIKAKRIRSIEEKQTQKIDEHPEDEFIGILNYCILALIQLQLPGEAPLELENAEVLQLYDREAQHAKDLMEKKNHDYGEVWREMYVTSFTDLILVKLLRIRQILENSGKTIVSEGIEANLYDIINYSIFALIKLNERNGKDNNMD